MNRTSPPSFDLTKPQFIWARPDEDLVLTMDFGEDVSGWTFTLLYSEHRWPYMPVSYDTLTPGSITTGMTFSDGEGGVTGALLTITIDQTDIVNWENRTLDLRLQADNGTQKWIAVDRTVTISQGD